LSKCRNARVPGNRNRECHGYHQQSAAFQKQPDVAEELHRPHDITAWWHIDGPSALLYTGSDSRGNRRSIKSDIVALRTKVPHVAHPSRIGQPRHRNQQKSGNPKTATDLLQFEHLDR
jgi:hypothetical protein